MSVSRSVSVTEDFASNHFEQQNCPKPWTWYHCHGRKSRPQILMLYWPQSISPWSQIRRLMVEGWDQTFSNWVTRNIRKVTICGTWWFPSLQHVIIHMWRTVGRECIMLETTGLHTRWFLIDYKAIMFWFHCSELVFWSLR